MFFDIYDPANDRHYVGARIGDSRVGEGQDTLGSQGRIWRPDTPQDLLSWTNGDSGDGGIATLLWPDSTSLPRPIRRITSRAKPMA